MTKTCVDEECKYYTELFEKIDEEWDYYSFCTKGKTFIPYKNRICGIYTKARKCYNCNHSKSIVYETGTIDCIDYHCELQDDKMIYSDLNFSNSNYAEFPDCNIDRWKSR